MPTEGYQSKAVKEMSTTKSLAVYFNSSEKVQLLLLSSFVFGKG